MYLAELALSELLDELHMIPRQFVQMDGPEIQGGGGGPRDPAVRPGGQRREGGRQRGHITVSDLHVELRQVQRIRNAYIGGGVKESVVVSGGGGVLVANGAVAAAPARGREPALGGCL